MQAYTYKKDEGVCGERGVREVFRFAEENAPDLVEVMVRHDYQTVNDLYIANITRKAYGEFQHDANRSLAIAITLMLASDMTMQKEVEDTWTPFYYSIIAQQRMAASLISLRRPRGGLLRIHHINI